MFSLFAWSRESQDAFSISSKIYYNGHDSGRGILQNAELCSNDCEGTVGD